VDDEAHIPAPFATIGCESGFDATTSILKTDERYRARLKSDPQALENFALAQSQRLILREERNFVEVADATFGLPSTLAGPA
jgi:hypothetical protein